MSDLKSNKLNKKKIRNELEMNEFVRKFINPNMWQFLTRNMLEL